jgi:hypothetical protein
MYLEIYAIAARGNTYCCGNCRFMLCIWRCWVYLVTQDHSDDLEHACGRRDRPARDQPRGNDQLWIPAVIEVVELCERRIFSWHLCGSDVSLQRWGEQYDHYVVQQRHPSLGLSSELLGQRQFCSRQCGDRDQLRCWSSDRVDVEYRIDRDHLYVIAGTEFGLQSLAE